MEELVTRLKEAYSKLSSPSLAEVESGRLVFEKELSDPNSAFALLQWLRLAATKNEILFILLQLEKSTSQSQKLTQENSILLLDELISLIKLEPVGFEYKTKIFDILVSFVHSPIISNRSNHSRRLFDIIKKNFAIVLSPEASFDFSVANNFQFAVFLLRALFRCAPDLVARTFIHQEQTQTIINIYQQFLSQKSIELGSLEFSENQLQSSKALREKCGGIIELFVNFSELLSDFFSSHQKTFRHSKQNRYFKLSDFLNIVQEIFSLSISNSSQIKGIFNPTAFQEINGLILKVFSNTLPLVRVLQKFLVENSEMENSNSTTSLLSIVKICIHSLSMLLKTNIQKLDEISDESEFDLLLSNLLNFLQTSASYPYSLDYFSSSKQIIVCDIFLPLLIENTLSLEDISDNPVQFANAALQFSLGDGSDETSYKGNLKKAIAKFSRFVDGFLSFSFQFTIQVLDFIFEGCPVDKLESQFPLLKESEQSNFILHANSDQKIESGLLLLTILNTEIKERKDLFVLFQSFFFKNADNILRNFQSELIKIRFLNLYFTFKNNLSFKKDDINNEYLNRIHLWILSQIQGNDALSLIAVQVITDLIKEQKQIKFFETNQLGICETICKVLPSTKSISFLEFVKKFVVLQKEFFIDQRNIFINIFSTFIQKIENEFRGAESNSKGIILSCFVFLREVTKSELFADSFFFEIDSSLGSILSLVQEIGTEFDEDYFDVYYSLMKNSSKVSTNFDKLLDSFSKSLHTSEGDIKFFPLLSLMIGRYHSSWPIEKIQKVFLIIQESLSSEPQEDDYNLIKTSGKSLLLLQIFIQSFPNEVKDLLLPYIFSFYDEWNLKFEQDSMTFAKVFDKIQGILFSFGFVLPDLMFQFIESKSSLTPLLESIFTNIREFTTEYDRKLLVNFLSLCIKYYISKPNAHMLIKILNNLIPFIKFQELAFLKISLDSSKQKSQNEKNPVYQSIKTDFAEIFDYFGLYETKELKRFDPEPLEEGEIDPEELLENASMNLKERQKLINLLESPVLKYDELAAFKKVVLSLYSLPECSIDSLLAALNKLAKKHYHSVVHRIQYVGGPSQRSAPIIREIVKFKRAV